MQARAQSGEAGAARRWPRPARLCFRSPLRLLTAQVSSYGDKQTGPANDKPPSILNGVGIAQHLNPQLPLNLTFTDDAGKQVHAGQLLRQAAGDSGAGLLPVPHAVLGRAERPDERACRWCSYVPGKDFNIIVVSIDPTEGTDLAAAKKREIREALRPSGDGGRLALPDRHAAEYRRADPGGGLSAT